MPRSSVQTDQPLKTLLKACPQDLLEVFGEIGAAVVSVDTLEIGQLQRRVDGVMHLRRGQDEWLHHVEFQSSAEPMEQRAFEYNALLNLHGELPVVTSVVYLYPPAPERLAYQVRIGARVINRWSFGVVRLFEWNAHQVVAAGTPGLLALVPLMRGGDDLDLIAEAARRIELAFPNQDLPDAEDVLLALIPSRYSRDDLLRIVGRKRLIDSRLLQDALAEGEAKGEAKGIAKGRAEGETRGRVHAERELCLEVAREYHPGLVGRAARRIEACEDEATLRRWLMAAPRLTHDEWGALIGLARRKPGDSARRPRRQRA